MSVCADHYQRNFSLDPHLHQCTFYQGPRRIKEALRDRYEVSPDRLFVTYGVDEAIHQVLGLSSRVRPVLTFWPAYPFPDRFAANFGKPVVRVTLDNLGEYPDTLPGEAVAANPDVVVVVNPTNPGGRTLSHETLARYRRQLPEALFVVDEAYADFASDASMLHHAAESDSMLVLRSLSKGYGLPGLRVGWTVSGDAALASSLEGSRFYFFTPLSIEGAVWVLHHPDYLDETLRMNLAIKKRLTALVERIPGLSAVPTMTNYVLVRMDDSLSASRLQKNCDEAGLVLWWFNETPLFRDYFGAPAKHGSLRRVFRLSPVARSELDRLDRLLTACTARAKV